MIENWSLLTHMEACITTGGILGTNPPIVTEYMGISLVRTNNIISKDS